MLNPFAMVLPGLKYNVWSKREMMYTHWAGLIRNVKMGKKPYLFPTKRKRTTGVNGLYLNMDSIPGKLFNSFACVENNWYNEKWDLRPGVAFLIFHDKDDQRQFDTFVWEQWREVEDGYVEALRRKQYIRMPSTEDYFIGGWSKANETWYLYEQYIGLTDSRLIDKLPELSN